MAKTELQRRRDREKIRPKQPMPVLTKWDLDKSIPNPNSRQTSDAKKKAPSKW